VLRCVCKDLFVAVWVSMSVCLLLCLWPKCCTATSSIEPKRRPGQNRKATRWQMERAQINVTLTQCWQGSSTVTPAPRITILASPRSHPSRPPSRLKFGTLFARVCRFVKRVSGRRRGDVWVPGLIGNAIDFGPLTNVQEQHSPRGMPYTLQPEEISQLIFKWLKEVLTNVSYP